MGKITVEILRARCGPNILPELIQVVAVMTLEPYDAQRIDALTLRALDVCVRLRKLSQVVREEDLAPIALHDRKALEWLEKLEDWLLRCEGEVHRLATKARGRRLARETQVRLERSTTEGT